MATIGTAFLSEMHVGGRSRSDLIGRGLDPAPPRLVQPFMQQSDKRQGNRSLRASGDWWRRYDDAAALALGREGGCMLSRSGAVRRELHR